MQTSIFKNYETLSKHAADEIIKLLISHPAAVICLATGDTPRLTYELMVKAAMDQKIDFSQCSFVALDEWVGIPPQNEGSCHYFLQENIFKPLQIDPANIYLFDALTNDLEIECSKMDKLIKDKGGIDLMLVGVGMNGHIGFNEPGTSTETFTHVVDLDHTTQSVGQKYFTTQTQIKQGITLGLKHFLESKKVMMMASGKKKAGIMKQVLEEAITPAIPASIIRMHENAVVMMDEEAASLIH